jgi:1,3-beta-galactosyl-N-acetylhexosamine phosphorylase
MYNHITNQWEEEHRIPIDIRYPEVQEHILKVLQGWLEEHTHTDVVRFTTFFYNFDLIYNQYGKEKQVNWFGYLSCVSPKAMEDFQNIYHYGLSAEDFTDGGRYHTLFENPSRKYLDWMDFNQRFVAGYAKQCVDAVHRYGKKAIMFLGDHWIGTEPYGKYFPEIGLDGVVGAAGDGVTTRMIADIPVAETEARFYPYFFPDIFYDGGNPVKESIPVWIKCRRALCRKPMARMGYGGYLSLAGKFPDFIEHVTEISKQFKSIHTETKGEAAYSAPFKVAVLNSWGRIRSWQTHQIAHSLWNQRCYSYLGVLEALAGLPFEIEFISFEQVKSEGIPKDTGVIINAGDALTSWSGAHWWLDQDILVKLRSFVHQGGGFIGIGEPTAYETEGKLFQLSDVLGVQKELGLTASINKKPLQAEKEHFILQGCHDKIDYGEGMTMIYPCEKEVKVLDITRSSCGLTVHEYGRGRSVYIAGLPYSEQNSRILQRSIFWCAGKEEEMLQYYSANILVDCHGFPGLRKYCLINNSEQLQETDIYINGNLHTHQKLQPIDSPG